MNGLIRWFSGNHVAANLLMVTILVSGLMSARSIKQEVFPELDMDMITVSVPYLGGTPADVEEGVCLIVEDKLQGIEGIKKITSTASEGVGTIMLELQRGTDKRKALDDVKAAVDRIITFPEETEKPIISLVERKHQVIDIYLYGNTDERTLKLLADRVRDDLLASDTISYAVTNGTRPFEISIEVSEKNLRRYGLTLEQVTRAVQAGSLDLPGGSVKTEAGEILVRTQGRRYTGKEFGHIIVVSAPDGTEIPLSRLADIKDGFEDVDVATFLDGRPAAMVSVFRTGDQGVLEVTRKVKSYIEKISGELPPGIDITTWHDRSAVYKSRMDLLLKNGAMGLVLVFLVLALTLEFRLALWVSSGILVAFLGALWVIPWFGVSLNMISMFAFIVSLGLVVDDAIVIGENVYSHRQQGYGAQKASTLGTMEVAGPVVFAVMTTVAAFLPLAFIEGMMGKFMYNIPVVVIAILAFSLIESLLILPAHLATIKVRQVSAGVPAADPRPRWYARLKDGLEGNMQGFLDRAYRPALEFALHNRALIVAIAVATLVTTLSWFAGGHLKFVFIPPVDADNLVADLTLPQGTTVAEARTAAEQLERSLEEMLAEFSRNRPEDAPPLMNHVSTSIGSQPLANESSNGNTPGGAHLVEVNAELLPAEIRNLPSHEMADRWRELCGPIPGAVALTFSADLFHGGKPIFVQLSSPDSDLLVAAGRILKRKLAVYPGVTDISDSFRQGKVEMKLRLKPGARTLGLTLADLARQVRAGFYGDEAMRIQRGRDEVKVMVRYPADERRSLGDIEAMRIRTPAGAAVPFNQVAEVTMGRGYATIQRSNRQRVVNVTADVNQALANADEINQDLRREILPELLASFPGLSYSMEGQAKEQQDSLASLRSGFMMALLMIFALLAVLFRSYMQPVIIMTAIPFGIVGAIWGHLLMGMDLTMVSLFGLVALTGVVVNDSLIMIDFINRSYRAGTPLRKAVIGAGMRRFRPIMLTSVTTFAGLTPLLLEKSLQAKFLIPMATSLGFGVMFSTAITLVLVPVSFTLLVDFKHLFGLEKDYTLEPDDDQAMP